MTLARWTQPLCPLCLWQCLCLWIALWAQSGQRYALLLLLGFESTDECAKYLYFTIARLCTTFQHQVYYQLPVVGCVSLTSLSIACACPFGWGCALKTIAPIFSVTIIFIILPILLWFVSIQFILQSTNTIVENENCLCLHKKLTQTKVCLHNKSE